MNKVFLLGRLGNDPDITFSNGGKMIAKFRLATTRKYNGSEETTWHNIVYFDKLAEIVAKFATKGKQVLVEGRLSYYEKDDFKKTEIIGEEIQLLGSPSQNTSTKPTGGKFEPPAYHDYDDFDSEIPF